MKKTNFTLILVGLLLFPAAVYAGITDLIESASIVILWKTSATFRAIMVTIFMFLWSWKVLVPIMQLTEFDDRWTWFGAESDLKDKPQFIIAIIISVLLGLWTIKALFVAIFLS